MRGKNRLVSTVGSTPVVVRLVDLTEEALRIVLVNLLKPKIAETETFSRGELFSGMSQSHLFARNG